MGPLYPSRHPCNAGGRRVIRASTGSKGCQKINSPVLPPACFGSRICRAADACRTKSDAVIVALCGGMRQSFQHQTGNKTSHLDRMFWLDSTTDETRLRSGNIPRAGESAKQGTECLAHHTALRSSGTQASILCNATSRTSNTAIADLDRQHHDLDALSVSRRIERTCHVNVSDA